jgi:hypothetical protein
MERFTNLLEQLAKMLELPPLVLDSSGFATLAIDDDALVCIGFDEEQELLLLYCPVSMLPEDDAPARMAELLTANAFYQETAGFVLAVYNGIVLLQAAIPVAALDSSGLFKIVERLVHTRDYWNERLEPDESSTAPETDKKAASLPGAFAKPGMIAYA